MIAPVIVISLLSSALAGGVGKAWEVSPNSNAENLPRLRSNQSAFEVRSISGIGHRSTQHLRLPAVKKNLDYQQEFSGQNDAEVRDDSGEIVEVAKEAEDMEKEYKPIMLYDKPVFKVYKSQHRDVEMLPGPYEKSQRQDKSVKNRFTCPETVEQVDDDADDGELIPPRVRRNAEENQMEKISSTNNVREPRLNSPESWSKQPISVEFRHQANVEEFPTGENESTRAALTSSQQVPQTDFVTANRRSYSENREARDLPMSRALDDAGHRNSFYDRDLDIPYPRGYYYPDNFRTEREYYVRGLNDPGMYPDRYRVDDFDLYRNRPTPKPKRIIYYATLPEVVRKPVDLRYTRPYDTVGRASVNRETAYKRLPAPVDSRYWYRPPPYHPYDHYDSYGKRFNYVDRSYTPYNDRLEEDRYREQDLDHASFKEAPRNEDLTLNPESRRAADDKLPWPVQIGAEVNVKDSQRVSGRKVFASQQDFDRFHPSNRVERNENPTSGHSSDKN